MASLKEMRSSRKAKKLKLDGFTSLRKTDKDSLYTGIDEILQCNGTKRQAYHGGELDGGHIGTLMERAEEIMGKVEAYLIDSKKNLVNESSNQEPASDDDIRFTCKNIKELLMLWNTVEDCNTTQQFIDAAISIGDEMGMSRTIKIHGCISHIVPQMRRIPCGLSDFDENFMEQYHQTGYGFDVKLKHVKNFEKKGDIAAARLRRSEHQETKAAIQRVVDQHAKGKRKRTIASDEAKHYRKKERREAFKLPE